MASSANPDLWLDLSGFGSSDAGTSDARAALLKVNADMFVAAPARDRESIETFEALVLGFLPRADPETLRDLARILAPCEDTPASILDYLSSHSSDAREIVLRHGRRPLASRCKPLATPQGRLELASQADLDPAAVRKLLVLQESAVEDRLAANPALAPSDPGFAELLQRARHRPALAHILHKRGDLAPADEAALYLTADPERRHAIRDQIEAFLAQRRVTLSFALTEQDVAGLLTAGLGGEVEPLESQLTSLFGFPAATEWRVLAIGRHRLLVLALKALGVEQREALRILLNLHPALSYPLSAIKELAREMRDVSGPVALMLVESILGVRALSGQTLT